MDGYAISVPGRTEVAGNHEDHQGGCVIAAAVDRRICCTAQPQREPMIVVESNGFSPFALSLADPDFARPHISERNTTRALVRGMAALLEERQVRIAPCRLTFESDIPVGMGLSSSAAFELCCGAALLQIAKASGSPTDNIEPIDLAKVACDAERKYFGKPSGLMDQASCCLGGVNFIDFKDRESPQITPVDLPPSWSDFSYILVECESGHEDATSDYAQVARDMAEVARFFRVHQLRDITLEKYLDSFKQVRLALGDRAALRGYHFFNELSLVQRRLKALQHDNMPKFVELSNLSGISSAEYLHNVSMPSTSQPAMVALAFCRMALEEAFLETAKATGSAERGSARIHGGGFGGTIQVILPRAQEPCFRRRIEELLGPNSYVTLQLGTAGLLVEAD